MNLIRTTLIILHLSAFACLSFVSSPSVAQDNSQSNTDSSDNVELEYNNLVGNWRIQIDDKVGGHIEGEMSFPAGIFQGRKVGSWFRSALGSDTLALQNISLKGNKLYTRFFAHALFPEVGKPRDRHMNVTFAPDGLSAFGTMHWGDETFATVTMQKMVPSLTARVLPISNTKRGSMIDIILTGTGLPRHMYKWMQFYDVSVDDPGLQFSKINTYESGWKLTLRQGGASLLPGRKRITINGAEVPVDIVFEDKTESAEADKASTEENSLSARNQISKVNLTNSDESLRFQDPRSGNIYFLHKPLTSWSEASNLCSGLYNGHLATIGSASEQRFIRMLADKCEGGGCWLGANDLSTEGEFEWITGEAFSYKNWNQGEPNNDCDGEDYLMILHNGFWHDQSIDGACSDWGLNSPLCEVQGTSPVADTSAGMTVIATEYADGSWSMLHEEPEGQVNQIDMYSPDGSGGKSVSKLDPETGITRTQIQDALGQNALLESVMTINPFGDANLLQVDEIGNQTEVVGLTGGPTIIRSRDIYGHERESIVLDDDTTITSSQTPLGYRIESIEVPDGQTRISTYDADGTLISTTRRNADGSATTTDAYGRSRTVSASSADGSMQVVERDLRGNRTIISVQEDGTVDVQHTRTEDYAPGEDYYINTLNGITPWEELDESEKKRFAYSEQVIQSNRDAESIRQLQAELRQREKSKQQQRFEQMDVELDASLEKLRKEHEDAERLALERQARLARENERDEARQQMEKLEHQIRFAREAGDHDKQRRLEAEHDRLHDATLNLFAPTEEEQAEIARKQQVRNTLLDDVGLTARRLADMAYREMNVNQELTEDLAAGGRYVSIGAEMQHVLAQNQKIAMREKAGAMGWFQAIEQKLKDPQTTKEEREILTDMTKIARVRQEGGDRLLNDNAKIITAGYLFDVATLSAGAAGKAAASLGKAAASVGSKAVTRQVYARAAASSFANKISAGATRAQATQAAQSAGERAVADVVSRASKWKTAAADSWLGANFSDLGAALTKQRQLPATVQPMMNRLAEHKVAESVVIDAAVGSTIDAGIQLYQTGTIDPAETIRGAIAGGMLAGISTTKGSVSSRNKTRAENITPHPDKTLQSGDTTVDDLYAGHDVFDDSEDLLESSYVEPPIGQRSRHLTEQDIRRLHQPGRDLTGEEIQAKADLYRDYIQRRGAVARANAEARPPSELKGKVRDFFVQHDRIQNALSEVTPSSMSSGKPLNKPSDTVDTPFVTNDSWTESPTRLDGNQRLSGDTERYNNSTQPESVPSMRPARQSHETVRLEQPVDQAGPDDATMILDDKGRPMLAPDGKTIVTTESQIKPHETVRLEQPVDQAGPDDATMILDDKGRPMLAPDGKTIATTESQIKPHETVRLEQQVDQAGPDDATMILDDKGRPMLAPDGKTIVTTESQINPHETIRLERPVNEAGPDDATMILDKEGRPQLNSDGSVRTTDVMPESPNRPALSVDELLPEDLISNESVVDRNIPQVEELVPDPGEKSTRLEQLKHTDDIRNMMIVRELEKGWIEHSKKIKHIVGKKQARADQLRAEAPRFTGRSIRKSIPHLVKGDEARLGAIMQKASAYVGSQDYIYAETVNVYAQQMIDGTFKWKNIHEKGRISFSVNNDKILAHGHHRFVAAVIASEVTGRPIMNAENAIIPKEGFTSSFMEIEDYRSRGFKDFTVREGLKPEDNSD